MGFIDKLKNVFFEEVEEEEEETIEEQPVKFAKKIDVPKRKERIIEKTEAFKEDEFTNEENVTEKSKVESFVMQEETYEIPKIQEDDYNKMPMMFDEEDFFDNTYQEEVKKEYKPTTRETRMEKKELYQGKKEPTYVESVSKSYTNTYAKSYYDNKESKGFKPSPIISPIYGVLDKNYRKEEVVTKKDNKSSVNSYRKVDLDSVRNKAFGNESVKEEKKLDKVEVKKEVKVEVKKEEKTLYDVNKSKPDINKITLADADEYYNDLGLAYNVDYNDASRDTRVNRSKRYHDEEKESHDDEGNDNLFDLIDLMYNKED